MRLIDADALTERIKYCIDQGMGASRAYMFMHMIDEAPTIDAVSVVHGEWKPNPKIGWGETWVCSICGEKTTSSVMGYPRYNYCPMCGADMRGTNNARHNIDTK